MTKKNKTSGPAGPAEKPRKPTRAEKVENTRRALFKAAAEVVGENGYQGAMVSEITARANVAPGTFYNYFESLQGLLDQLLPEIGRNMLAYIREQGDASSESEREIQRFNAYFRFLHKQPEFYRILFEAEVFAPEAFREHREMVGRGFTRVLGRAQERGELQDFEPRELEVLAYILMGARHYLSMRYARKDGRPARIPAWVSETYDKLLHQGLFTARRPAPRKGDSNA